MRDDRFGRINKGAVPHFQTENTPQRIAPILDTFFMVGKHAINLPTIEESAIAKRLRADKVPAPLPQTVSKPVCDRCNEPFLVGSSGNLRQSIFEITAQNPFGLRSPDLVLTGKSERELHEAVIQERATGLDRMSHAVAVVVVQERRQRRYSEAHEKLSLQRASRTHFRNPYPILALKCLSLEVRGKVMGSSALPKVFVSGDA